MRHIKQPVIAIITVLFLASGIPVFSPDDANRDCRIDLKDAIIWVGQFARSADNPASFPETIKNAVSALRIAAGLTVSIRADKNSKSNVRSMPAKLPYLLSGMTGTFTPEMWFCISEESWNYRSIDRILDSPPPRNC